MLVQSYIPVLYSSILALRSYWTKDVTVQTVTAIPFYPAMASRYYCIGVLRRVTIMQTKAN